MVRTKEATITEICHGFSSSGTDISLLPGTPQSGGRVHATGLEAHEGGVKNMNFFFIRVQIALFLPHFRNHNGFCAPRGTLQVPTASLKGTSSECGGYLQRVSGVPAACLEGTHSGLEDGCGCYGEHPQRVLEVLTACFGFTAAGLEETRNVFIIMQRI